MRLIKHLQQGGFIHLLSVGRQWLAYYLEYLVFGLERAILTDRQWFRYTVWRNQRGVDAAADPRELRYVDPATITRSSPWRAQFCLRKLGAVRGGNWDVDSIPLAEKFDYIWNALESRYVDGKAWEDVELVREVAAGNKRWRFATGEEVWEWVDELDEVYHSIRTDGYRSTRESYDVSFEEAAEPSYDSLIERFRPITNESMFFSGTDDVMISDWLSDIQVDIGRDGEFIQHNGRHRIWFAQHLDVDEIPVCIVVRHEEWQRLRDEVANASSTAELSYRAERHLDHPDMVDVVGDLSVPERPADPPENRPSSQRTVSVNRSDSISI